MLAEDVDHYIWTIRELNVCNKHSRARETLNNNCGSGIFSKNDGCLYSCFYAEGCVFRSLAIGPLGGIADATDSCHPLFKSAGPFASSTHRIRRGLLVALPCQCLDGEYKERTEDRVYAYVDGAEERGRKRLGRQEGVVST